MTRWYTPKLGLRTGVRVVLSSVFGNFADRRTIMALESPASDAALDPAMDYGGVVPEGGFWLDYMSDTGDGYDATFAMARMLAQEGLTPAGSEEALKQGRVLVLGGDEVYPDPSKDEYQRRFIDPFEAASRTERGAETGGADMYALPGNHDWYDGLIAFGHLFCRRRIKVPGQATVSRPGRRIGFWNTQQTRSYFALKLPGNWWLWAVDSQLAGYVDQAQVEYFAHVGRHWMDAGSNVVLAVSSPGWVGAAQALDQKAFLQFDYVSTLAERIKDPEGNPKDHRVRLILTGDHHHYVRYEERGPEGPVQSDDGQAPRPRTLIVAGGGGAFLHPTHHLDPVERHPLEGKAEERNGLTERQFRIAHKANGAEALYPSRDDSRALTKNNLAFAFLNPGMTTTLFGIYLFFIWTLSLWSEALHGQTLLALIAGQSWWSALCTYAGLITHAPTHLLAVLGSFAAYYTFTGAARWRVRWIAGGLHWLAQTLGALLTGWGVLQLFSPAQGGAAAFPEFPIVVLGAACAALVSATLFGLYLWIMLNVFGRHYNEAFSSIRIDQFRNFLRLKIDGNGGLTVYPIGLREVPRSDDAYRAPKPEMIEPPIHFAP